MPSPAAPTNQTWEASPERASLRGVVELVYQEAHRNERRINRVKMALVAPGAVMSLVFWLKVGPDAAKVMGAQLSIMGAWLLFMGVVGVILRRPCMHRAVPYTVLTVDVVMIGLMVAVRMMWTPEAYAVHDGVLSEWVFMMLFPILVSAAPRFDRDVARYAELLVTVCTLALLAFGVTVLGDKPRPIYVMVTLVAVLATGRFTVMVTHRGWRLLVKTVRLGADQERGGDTFQL